MSLWLKSPPKGEYWTYVLAGAGWNPCDPAGHVPSTATEKWEQTASSHKAPTPYRDLKTASHRVLRWLIVPCIKLIFTEFDFRLDFKG